MYKKGLVHKVDIYPMERNTSNRTQKNQMKAKEKILEDILCRIIKMKRLCLKGYCSWHWRCS